MDLWFLYKFFWKYRVYVLIFLLANTLLVLIFEIYHIPRLWDSLPSMKRARSSGLVEEEVVEIWGKAAIGLYLWEHILGGTLVKHNDKLSRLGYQKFYNTTFIFRTGAGFIQTTVPQNVKWLILTLDGRIAEQVAYAKSWLDYLENYHSLKGVIVVLKGNERCENDWILKYLRSRGGRVDALFLVYDSLLVDNKEIFQWPLGVATYRNFPVNCVSENSLSFRCHYPCSFVGTVYENSSRQSLLSEISRQNVPCYILPRYQWVPKETPESLDLYLMSLKFSDVTLAPVGMNSESYRIYEAFSCGSLLLLEDRSTPGFCNSVPFRMLNEYNAPVIKVKNWNNLGDIVRNITSIEIDELIKKRKESFNWYKNFKNSVKMKFLHVVNQKFFC